MYLALCMVHTTIDDSDILIDHALDQIANKAARIIYVSTTIPQSGILMCKAANRNLIWPGFVWIFQSVLQANIVKTSGYRISCVESSICFLFTTITLLLMLCLYKIPEIRATSPLLSILIFIGAYMNIITGALILTVQSIVVNSLYFILLYVMLLLIYLKLDSILS